MPTTIEQERRRLRDAAMHWDRRRVTLAEEAKKIRAYRSVIMTPSDKMLFNDYLENVQVMMAMCRKLAKGARDRFAAI